MPKDTQWQDWDLSLHLDFWTPRPVLTPRFIVALDFRILGQHGTPCWSERGWGWRWSPLTCLPLCSTLASRLLWKHTSSLKVTNEPILAFTQGSPEREALQKVRKGGGTQGV